MKNSNRLFAIFIGVVSIGTFLLLFLQVNRTKREIEFETKQRKSVKAVKETASPTPISNEIADPNLSFSIRVADASALLAASHVLAVSLVAENKSFDSLQLAHELENKQLIPPGMAFLEPTQDFPFGFFVSHRLDGFFLLRCQSNSGVVEVLACPRVPGKDGEPALLRFPETFGKDIQAALYIAPNCNIPIPPYLTDMFEMQRSGWFCAPFRPDRKSELETISAGLWRAKHPLDK